MVIPNELRCQNDAVGVLACFHSNKFTAGRAIGPKEAFGLPEFAWFVHVLAKALLCSVPESFCL